MKHERRIQPQGDERDARTKGIAMMHPSNREVIEKPGLTIVRYNPVPLDVRECYPWQDAPAGGDD